jgi:AraC-like DNA-binding protein
MNHWQYQPHAVLSPFVECLWVSTEDFTDPSRVLEILPDAEIELIFAFGSPVWVEHAGITRSIPACFAVGLLTKPIRFGASGPVTALAARFNPGGFYTLVGSLMDFSQQPVGGLGEDWVALTGQIEKALVTDGRDAAVGVLHDFLIERAVNATWDRQVINAATTELQREKGQIKIAQLADRCRVSTRQLEREFQKRARTTPKSLSQLMRFQHVRDALWRDPWLNLNDLALRAGYADQAHFTREFRRLAQRTPQQFAAHMRATREHLSASGVAFLQDESGIKRA